MVEVEKEKKSGIAERRAVLEQIIIDWKDILENAQKHWKEKIQELKRKKAPASEITAAQKEAEEEAKVDLEEIKALEAALGKTRRMGRVRRRGKVDIDRKGNSEIRKDALSDAEKDLEKAITVFRSWNKKLIDAEDLWESKVDKFEKNPDTKEELDLAAKIEKLEEEAFLADKEIVKFKSEVKILQRQKVPLVERAEKAVKKAQKHLDLRLRILDKGEKDHKRLKEKYKGDLQNKVFKLRDAELTRYVKAQKLTVAKAKEALKEEEKKLKDLKSKTEIKKDAESDLKEDIRLIDEALSIAEGTIKSGKEMIEFGKKTKDDKTIRGGEELLEQGELEAEGAKKELKKAKEELRNLKMKGEKSEMKKDAESNAKKKWEEAKKALRDERDKWDKKVGHRGGEGVGGDAWHEERESALAKLVVARDKAYDEWKKIKSAKKKDIKFKKYHDENTDLSAKLERVENKLLRKEMTDKISSDYCSLELTEPNFTDALMDIEKSCSSETSEAIHSILKSCNDKTTTTVRKSSGAWDKIETAAEEIRKEDSSISAEQSVLKAINKNPDLYEDYQKEAN